MKWEDVDGDLLHINRAVYIENGKPTVTDDLAKTITSIRTIPLIPVLKAQIESLPRNGEYIFGSSTGSLMYPRNFNRAYSIFFEEFIASGKGDRILSPHCCRHTTATLALKNGADLSTVQKLLGHASPETTMRYIHHDKEMLQNALTDMYNAVTAKSVGQFVGQHEKTANH